MRAVFTVLGLVGCGLLAGGGALAQQAPAAPPGLTPATPTTITHAPVAAPAPQSAPGAAPSADGKPPVAPKAAPQDDTRTTLMGHQMENDHNGAYIQCEACVPLSSGSAERGERLLKFMKDNDGALPDTLVRLKSEEIDALLRGMSWTSSVIANADGNKWDRLLAFDADGRGRFLNFLHGPRDYSTLCQYQVDEDLLCMSCNTAPAQCSEVYHDPSTKDFYVAYDREKGRVEVYDWIKKSRWDGNRFLAPH